MASRAYSEQEGKWRQLPRTAGGARRWYARMANSSRARMSDGQRLERTGVGEQRLQRGGEQLRRRCDRVPRGDEHAQVSLWGRTRPTAPHDLPQAAPRTIALHRPTHTALAGDEAHTARLAGCSEHQQQAGPAAIGHTL